MKTLTVQLLIDDTWIDAATLTLPNPKLGVSAASKLGYDLDYALKHLENIDLHACSLLLPIQLMIEHESPRWFCFLEDIMPSGAARRFWVNHLGLKGLPEGEQDVLLLEKGTIAPVGNMRIKEALPSFDARSTLKERRFTVKDVVDRDSDFLEYAQQMGAISGGATGAGGEAPKLLIRCSDSDEVWIDSFQDQPENPDSYYLVKFPRNRRTSDDCDILRAEYHFYHELANMGVETISTENMHLIEGERYPSLWLPRFDVVWQHGKWQRLGMESVYSIMNKPAGSYLGHFDVVRTLSSILSASTNDFNVEVFVREWVRRDLLNVAFGNSDNHGRNSAALKAKGSVWLAPVYDFAPMKADPEGVVRTTRWGSPFEEGGEFRWTLIAEQLADLCSEEILMQELRDTAVALVGLKARLQERGVPKRILDMPAIGFEYLEEKLKRWELL